MLGSPKFPPPEKGLKTDQKICCPRQVKKEKTPHLTRRGNSNVLPHGPIILVLTVPEYDEQDISAQPIAPPRTRTHSTRSYSEWGATVGDSHGGRVSRNLK